MTYGEWLAVKQRFPLGAGLVGVVVGLEPFGVFVTVEGVHPFCVVADLAGMHKDAADESVVIWPEVGDSVTGVVVDHSEHNTELKIHLT